MRQRIGSQLQLYRPRLITLAAFHVEIGAASVGGPDLAALPARICIVDTPVHMTLAMMPSADQVPTNSSHSTMLWHKWIVLIARSTGSALRAVRPPNLQITPVARRDLVYAASATGSLYRSPLTIIAQTIRAIRVGERDGLCRRRASNAVSQGRCLVPWILA
jgi:hypothetical protein